MVSARLFWWASLDETIENYVKQYDSCQLNQSMPDYVPIHPWQSPSKPQVLRTSKFCRVLSWKNVFDFNRPLFGNDQAFSMDDIKSKTLIDCVYRFVFMNYLILSIMIIAYLLLEVNLKTFCQKKWTKTCYNLSLSSFFEWYSTKRAVPTFKNGSRKICQINSSTPFRTLLSRFLFSYRTPPYTQTGKTPSEMLFNRKVNTRLNVINLNPDPIKEEQKFLLSQTSKKI